MSWCCNLAVTLRRRPAKSQQNSARKGYALHCGRKQNRQHNGPHDLLYGDAATIEIYRHPHIGSREAGLDARWGHEQFAYFCANSVSGPECEAIAVAGNNHRMLDLSTSGVPPVSNASQRRDR